MKTKTMFTPALNARFVCIGTRRFRFGSSLSTVLVAGAALLGPVGGVHAQFPGAPMNEPAMQSAGVFQITLTAPNMIALMNPDASHVLQYVGWDPIGFTVTSPVLYDPETRIAVSGVHQREVTGTPTYFPVTVGVPLGPPPTPPLSQDVIGTSTPGPHQYYNDYVYPTTLSDGFDFQTIYAAGGGPNEVLTEIQAFSLSPLGICGGNSNSPAPPQLPPPDSWSNLGIALVRAGYDNSYNGGGGNYLKKSIGMVQSTYHPGTGSPDSVHDFPTVGGADSFFDIYVEVTLPPIPNSVSEFAFPVTGAILTNTLPLIITATDLSGFPPSVVYTHTGAPDNQFTVPLKFKDTSLKNIPGTTTPYYSAGDTFGTIVLAGHGLLDPCAKANNLEIFVNAVFGPPEQLAPRGVVGRHFSNALFPSTDSLYVSAPGTNFGGRSVDAVLFTNGATVLRARSFRVSSFANPISLPPANSSVIYTNTNTVVTFDISTDNTNFISASGAGQMQVLIVNSNSPAGNTRYFTELLALDVSGSSGSGQFALRESPTKASPGKHIVEDDGSGNFTIGGYFDASLEYSFNTGITYKPGSRPIRLEQIVSTACGPPGPLAAAFSGPSSVIISWSGSTFRLQGTVSLSSPNWVDIPGASPITVSPSGAYHFYRLICP
jgi:hypothetical protein